MRSTLFCFAALCVAPSPLHAEDGTLLGVLEEPQCKEATGVHVRVLYVKSAGKWHSLDSAASSAGHVSKKMTWTVMLHGKRLGDIETHDPGFGTQYDWTYSRDRLLNVVASPSIPSVPNQSLDFEGWCAPPKARPLVVVAHGGASDPENWMPFGATEKQAEALFHQFKAHNGEAWVCPDPDADDGVRFDYQPKDVRAVQSYRNKTGDYLITLAFKSRKDQRHNPDDGWSRQTFLVSRAITYVGANLSLVDIGDYDVDGASELLFWHSGYNKDGYILLSPGVDGRVEYLWSYH